MKECCKTGDEKAPSKLKKWAGRIIWGVVILLVIGIALMQMFKLNNNKMRNVMRKENSFNNDPGFSKLWSICATRSW